jgi:hypothetical protein
MSWRHGTIRGTRQREVAERIDALLDTQQEYDLAQLATLAGCSYWTASRHLYDQYIAKRVERRKANATGRPGRLTLLYRRRA